MSVDPLSYPAPRRMSIEQPNGTYYTVPWSLRGVQEYRAFGGRFVKGHHDFDSKETARAAGCGDVS